MSGKPGASTDAERWRELNRRLRAAYVAGAEARSQAAQGRGLSDEELQRIVARYPGDLPTVRWKPPIFFREFRPRVNVAAMRSLPGADPPGIRSPYRW